MMRFDLLRESHPVYGALLCFGRNPQACLAGALTRCIHWHGDTREGGWRDDQEYRSDLLTQFNSSLSFLRKCLRFSRVIGREGRTEQCEIPFVALEEALANALVHREYANRPESVQVEVFDSRIEIRSPGQLPPPMTLELLGVEDSCHPRNPLIARIFYLCGHVEKVGSGIKRMQRAMEEGGLLPPEFELSDAQTLKVILYRPKQVPEEIVESEEFGALLSHGIKSIAVASGKTMTAVKEELSAAIGLKTSHLLDKWQQGVVPSRSDQIAALARVCVQSSEVDRNWLQAFLKKARYSVPESLISELFPETPPRVEIPRVYHNLPQPDYGTFVGRKEELAQVHSTLRPYPHSREPLITIDGISGIGKSALALEVALRYLRDYDHLPSEERFEAIIWISAKASVLTADGIASRQQITRTLDDIYTTISVTLEREDITHARPEDQDELVTKALTQQRTLLIIDNLEVVDDERVNAFLRELPAPTKAIVTTRHRIDVAYPIRLTSMPKEDGLALIAQECAKKGVTLTEAEAEKLYERTGGVPLAVVWSVAQDGAWPSRRGCVASPGPAQRGHCPLLL
jgi:hypothetical protein